MQQAVKANAARALDVEDLSVRYGTSTAVDGVTLAIEPGEVVALLGPSGCGKTTLLRVIAGFVRQAAGRVRVDGATIDHLPPNQRNIGIVFQNYALWPHMSVEENVGYALKVAGVSSAERARRCREALATVGMEALGTRAPSDLSGGQRQRVALARCLAANPSVMLLDEPLANLDVHLRASMEREFLDFHRRTGASMIYITHDQSEAMALASRIAVMEAGRVMQFGKPRELYREPQNEMVARFIGGGLILPGTDATPSGRAGHAMVDIFGHRHEVRARSGQQQQAAVSICVHPGELAIAAGSEGGFAATITQVIFRGSHTQVDFHPHAMPDLQLTLQAPGDFALPSGSVIHVRAEDGWIIPDAG